MTDEQMDARLRAAGERWRDDNATVAVIEPAVTDAPAHAPIPSSRRRWGLLASAAAVAAALVVGGTFVLRDTHSGPTPSGDTAALEGHVWLVSGQGSTASLYVDRDGNLVADDECRLIGGHASVDGTTMTVTDQVVRYKSCTDQYGPGFYDAGTAVLDGASTFSISADALTITKDGKQLRFTLAPANLPVPSLDFPTLVDTSWRLISAKDETGADAPVAGAATLEITHGGALSATDGCDTVRADAVLEGPDITLDNIVTAVRRCAGNVNYAASGVLDFFSAGTIRELVVGGELTLTRGKALLTYRWQPQDAAATDPAQLRDVSWHLIGNAGTAIPLGTTVRFGTRTISAGGSGCDPVTADIAPGSLRVTGSSTGTPASGACSATSLYTFLEDESHTWRVADGQLIVFAGFQAGALVFSTVQPAPPNSQLLGPTWHLVSIITSHDVRYRNGAPPAEDSTLRFTDRGFAVQHVCYTQEGTAHATTTTVAFSGAHLVGAHPCPSQPGRDDAAQDVDSILAGTVNWSIDSGTLTLKDATGTLVYSQSPTHSDDRPLAGTPWRLETVVTDQGKALPATEQTLTVDASGHLVAEDGSNAINAQITAHDGGFTLADVAVGGVGSTQDDPVRDTIDQVLAQGEVRYDITGDTLTFTRGAAQLVYRATTDTGAAAIIGSWRLSTIQHGTRPATPPQSPVTVRVSGDGIGVGVNDTASASIDGTRVTFGAWTDGVVGTLSNDLSSMDANFVFGRLLTGTCSWTVRENRLMITKTGVGALVLTRS